MKRVFVTGARGFIGRHALATLRARGFDVHAVTRQAGLPLQDDVTWHQANILDVVTIKPLLQRVRPTHLLHFAWNAVPGQYWTTPDNFLWVQASLELVRRFQESGGVRVVMAGTCAEYDWAYGYCSELITPTTPSTTYGTCKLALQTLLDAYAREVGLSSAWGRIFMLYGPHEHPSRLVSSVARAILRGERIRCTHGNQLRDYLHVQDVADAFVALLDGDVTGPVNIASGQPVYLKEIIYKLADHVKRRDLVDLGVIPSAVDEPHLLCADIRRLSDAVGWMPRFNLDRGLEHTLDWWKSQFTEGVI